MTAKSFALFEWLSVSDVWIGLAEVEQRPGAGVLMGKNKAFVQVLAWRRTNESTVRWLP